MVVSVANSSLGNRETETQHEKKKFVFSASFEPGTLSKIEKMTKSKKRRKCPAPKFSCETFKPMGLETCSKFSVFDFTVFPVFDFAL